MFMKVFACFLKVLHVYEGFLLVFCKVTLSFCFKATAPADFCMC